MLPRPKFLMLLILLGGLVWGVSPIGAEPFSVDKLTGTPVLNLTPEQQSAFLELQSRFRQEMDLKRKKIMTLRLELRTLTPEEMEGPKGEGLRSEIRALILAGRERALYYQNEAWKLLTEAQRAGLPAGDDLGFRCHWGGFRGRGPGGEFRRPRPSSPSSSEKSPVQP